MVGFWLVFAVDYLRQRGDWGFFLLTVVIFILVHIHGMVSGSVKRYTVCDASVTAEGVVLVWFYFLPSCCMCSRCFCCCCPCMPWSCIMNLGIVHLLGT